MSDENMSRPPLAPSPADPAPPVPPRHIADVLRAEWRPRRTYPTGFATLDEKIGGGLKARQLAVIPAPTGVGKTGFAGTIALHNARAGVPVLWVLGELDPQEQTARFGALRMRQEMSAHATADQILGGHVPLDSVRKLLEGLPIYLLDLDDTSADRFALVEDQARQLIEQHGPAAGLIIVVDYLQCLADDSGEDARVPVSNVAKRLRRMAKGLDAAVVGISSVSRAYYGLAGRQRKLKGGDKEDPRDWLASAKESGDIEFAAGVVAYLDVSDEVDMLGEAMARLIVAKSRQGTVGFVGLKFHGPSGLYTEFDAAVKAMAPVVASAEGDDEIVARYIRKRCMAGKPCSRAELKSGVDGIGHDRKRDALTRLLEQGLVEEREQTRPNADGKQRKVDVLMWLGPVTPQHEERGDDE